MKSITIHGIDAPLWSMLKERAKSEGLSLNKLIKGLLEASLGITERVNQAKLEDFKEFCGIWSKSDGDNFKKKVDDFEKIEQKEWE